MKHFARTAAIARILLERSEPISASAIAETLAVSSKTVSRELPRLEAMLKEHGLALARKTGAGLSVAGAEAARKAMRKSLADAGETPAAFTPQERLTMLAGQLLKSTEPVKLFTLARYLNVTDGTVSNDLDKLEPWFRRYALTLVRRPGLGVYIHGQERDIRRAIVSILYENLDEEHLLRLVQEGGSADGRTASGRLLNLMDAKIVHRIERLVHEMESDLPHHFSDNAFIGLVVHLALAVQRMCKEEDIHIERAVLTDLCGRREYRVAEQLAERIGAAFAIDVPADEVGYITMHLLGARSRYLERQAGRAPALDNFHLVQLARAIIKRMEAETGKRLLHNQNLLLGLVNHLGPSISRLTMHMDIRNPLLEEMRRLYPHYMDIARMAAEPLEQELGMALPDAEVAYLAMHLGAALADADAPVREPVRVLVACPTGMGTSRLLASAVRRAFPNLRIVDTVSTLRITESYARESGAAFVLSTVPIPHAPLPVVVTGILLDEEGRAQIEAAIRMARRHGTACTRGEGSRPLLGEGMKKMIAYGTAIAAMLEGFFIEMVSPHMQDVDALCALAAKAAGAGEAVQKAIEQALRQREEKGSTILREHEIMLMHARAHGISVPRLGVLRLSAPFELADGTGRVRTILVLLAPKEAGEETIEAAGAVPAALMEEWSLFSALHDGSREYALEAISAVFHAFYARKFEEVIGAPADSDRF